MKFPPVFTLTPEIQKILYDLDVLKAGFMLHPLPQHQEMMIRRKTILKSSLFSARIEGNTLEATDLDTLERGNQDVEHREISNLVNAYESLPDVINRDVSLELIRELHKTVLMGISPDAGMFRTETSAIFNTAGVAVYVTPNPATLKPLLTDLCTFIYTCTYPAPVVAGISHIWFEKLHPFIDGNGRVGRTLCAFILKKGGYDFNGLVPFEEYLDTHRDDYYRELSSDTEDVTKFVRFFLSALVAQSTISLREAHTTAEDNKYLSLLPRRAEIMRIVEDHKVVTFDFLSRRFRAIPLRTLHNDIAQLVKSGHIRKMGATRGACYSVQR
jgi:Fic family protein